MKSIAVVDYKSGNIHSMASALNEALLANSIKGKVIRATEPKDIQKCDYLVLPGVGAFGDCKQGISELQQACEEHVLKHQKPFLGVCVGMQLLAQYGNEFGRAEGLGWIKGEVVKLKASRLPHMGWNDVEFVANHFLSEGLMENSPHFYFDHSYIFQNSDASTTLATTTYGESFSAALAQNNIAAVQFHPEKSQLTGIKFLTNFIRWKP